MQEILIIKPSSLGDIVHGLQVAQSIKTQMVKCRITWVVKEIFSPLILLCEAVDDCIIYHRHGGLRGFVGLLKEIRKRPWDVLIDMQGLARTGVMTGAARAVRKIGRSDSREGAAIFYREKAPLPQNGRKHALEILLEFLPLLDLNRELCGPLEFGEKPVESLDSEILNQRAVVMFPESRRMEKTWDGFSTLTEQLLRESEKELIVWAGSDQMPDPSECLPSRFFNLTGKTNLVELVALIKKAKVVVSNDSGPMHLAAALEIPVVALFGPTSPERFGPYPLDSPRNRVIRAPEGKLRELGVDEVFHAVSSIVLP